MLKSFVGFAIIVATLTVGQSAHASIVASLTANPSSINEGQATVLQFALNYSAPEAGTYWGPSAWVYEGSIAYRDYYYYSGTGQINSFTGSINSGNGQSASIGGTNVNSSSASQSHSFTYNSPSTYMASVAGTANVQNNFNYIRDIWRLTLGGYQHFYQTPLLTYGPGSPFSLSFNASTQVFVNNLSPSINQLTWDLVAYVGDAVSFAVGGIDPAGIGTTETMTFAYDLNNDGNYNDFLQTGSLSSSGTTSFQTAGVHQIGVRLTDGRGGTAFASFDVNVLDLPTPVPGAPEVPEPATLVIWGSLALVGVAFRRVALAKNSSHG